MSKVHNFRGTVRVQDDCTMLVSNFGYDGQGTTMHGAAIEQEERERLGGTRNREKARQKREKTEKERKKER